MRRRALPDGITEDFLRTLSADDLACWVLEQGYYRVDAATAAVWNALSGRQLKPLHNRVTGYFHVMLYAAPKVGRTISLHRLVGLAVWGAGRCRGMHVAHVDSDKAHNGIGNLELLEPSDHYNIDFRSRGRLTGNALGKTTWEPCARCGDPDGPRGKRNKTPTRTNGERFGVAGRICGRCYSHLHYLLIRRATDSDQDGPATASNRRQMGRPESELHTGLHTSHSGT